MSDIRENLDFVREAIRESCEKAGRAESEVTLIAVSKTKPIGMLREAYDCGAREFGENHVQEIVEKRDLMPEDAHFHMIGHLQTNKVKQVVGRVVMIHSVDTIHLAEKISQESVKRGIVTDVLLEVNVAGEESKYGFRMEDLPEALAQAQALPGIRVRGFMTVAPAVEDPEENRPVFRRLHDFYVDTKLKNHDNSNIDTLSMGMTGDYRVAIEEGATLVRVGTGIFGARDYSNR